MPPLHSDYAYEWIASDGDPSYYTGGRVFQWTAPDVESTEKVIIEVRILDKESGCLSRNQTEITVEPRPKNNKLALLSITKTASKDIIRPGESLDYTITFQNVGDKQAKNVTITDIIDKNLIFNPETDSDPKPIKVWTDLEGTHLWWNADTLNSKQLMPGISGNIKMKVTMPSSPEHPEIDKVYNKYKIDSDGIKGEFKTLETLIIHSLFIRKKADKAAYSDGETINYTIIYGNDLALDAENAVIYDILPDVEYVDATPQPTAINGNILFWDIGRIPAKESRNIQLYVKIKENYSEITFKSSGSVSGQGFANIHQKLDTAQKPDHLTNYANITADYLGVPDFDSTSAIIVLAEHLGTEATIAGHGSGIYKREEKAQLIEKNNSVKIKTSLLERYNPSYFSLPQGRSISYNSKWSEAQSANNRITGTVLSERYMYATSLDRNSSLDLDKNGSTLVSGTSFEGLAHIEFLKKANISETSKPKEGFTYESRDDYLGSFKVNIKFDEYGGNTVSELSASGTGSVATDNRIGKSQGSYESGTGLYKTEDHFETGTNYMVKNIDVSYEPINYTYTPSFNANLSKKWKEGMWSKSGMLSPKGSNSSKPASFIGEEISQAEYLKESAVAKGLNEMNTEREFSGIAQLKVMKNAGSNKNNNVIAFYNEYVGKYKISQKTMVGGVARFDEPHLSISKVGSINSPGSTLVNYVITVINDGNCALGPVYILDYFPTGTTYVYSSERPSELASDYAQWTLTNLGIGTSSNIELRLNMTQDMDNLINRVQAKGGYDDKWVSIANISAIELNWLSCCPPQILASKTGYVDAKDPMLVHYSILLKNREKYIMVASITDMLPEGMQFINSTLTPSDHRPDRIRWDVTDLRPGEVKTIDYLSRVLYSGIFENQAHIEAYSVDGSDSAFADVSCHIEVKGKGNPTVSPSWQPPKCFGLNCTQQYSGNEWIPCESCGMEEIQPLETNCPCSSTSGDDGGYENP